MAAVADAVDVLLAHPWVTLWWAFPIPTDTSHVKCWMSELLYQNTCGALRGLTLLVQSSLDMLVLVLVPVPASELSQGQPSASEELESENICLFSPSICGTVLRYVIHVSSEYPRGSESQQ